MEERGYRKADTEKFETVYERNTAYTMKSAKRKRPVFEKREREVKPKRENIFAKNRLLRNTAVCGLCALAVFAIANADTPEAQVVENAVKDVISYEYDEDDIGMLKFVDNTEEGDTVMVSGSEFVYPVDGIVTTTFAQSGSGAIMTSEENKEVVASVGGQIYDKTDNYVSTLSEDGSITTYFGVSSQLSPGDNVAVGEIIGNLLSDTLYIEKDIGGVKTDPFGE